MYERVRRQVLDVVRDDIVATSHCRQGLARAVERHRPARADAKRKVLALARDAREVLDEIAATAVTVGQTPGWL